MIIKETIEVRGVTRIPASHAAKVLAAGVQDDRPVVWVDEPYMESRIGRLTVFSVFTGDKAPEEARYINTIQNHGIVAHVYESNL